jgi:hypothetical protein
MARATTAHKILVIANQAVKHDALDAAMIAHDDVNVLVVAPALNTRIRHWTSDEDRARRDAATRLQASVATLNNASIPVRGWVGDADPMYAIADALVFFDAEELLISTPPEHRCNWLARDLVHRVGDRFKLPVTQTVVKEPATTSNAWRLAA